MAFVKTTIEKRGVIEEKVNNENEAILNIQIPTTLSGGIDVTVLSGSITSLSNSVATDVSFFRFPPNLVDTSGNRTITDQDNGKFVFMSGSSANIVRIPNTLSDSFNCYFVQASSNQIQVVATASINHPATFLTASAEENSMIFVYSASLGLFLGGDLELSGS